MQLLLELRNIYSADDSIGYLEYTLQASCQNKEKNLPKKPAPDGTVYSNGTVHSLLLVSRIYIVQFLSLSLNTLQDCS